MQMIQPENILDHRWLIHAVGHQNTSARFRHTDRFGKGFELILPCVKVISTIRMLTAHITNTYLCALDNIEKMLAKRYGDYNRYFRRMNIGGDDVNVLCAADIALEASELFAKRISETPLWNCGDTGSIPLSVSIGIAFVEGEIPYRMGQMLSIQCCETAKAFAKSHMKNGFAENYVYASFFEKTDDGSWIKSERRDAQPHKIPKE